MSLKEYHVPESKWRRAKEHPLHGVLNKIVKIKMPDGSIKPMEVKEAYRKGYLKTK